MESTTSDGVATATPHEDALHQQLQEAQKAQEALQAQLDDVQLEARLVAQNTPPGVAVHSEVAIAGVGATAAGVSGGADGVAAAVLPHGSRDHAVGQAAAIAGVAAGATQPGAHAAGATVATVATSLPPVAAPEDQWMQQLRQEAANKQQRAAEIQAKLRELEDLPDSEFKTLNSQAALERHLLEQERTTLVQEQADLAHKIAGTTPVSASSDIGVLRAQLVKVQSELTVSETERLELRTRLQEALVISKQKPTADGDGERTAICTVEMSLRQQGSC